MAQQTLDNGSTFGVQRTKINANFTDLYEKLNYKQYVALLSNNNGTVTVKILKNDIGAIVWTNPSNGRVDGTLSGVFVADKTFILNGGMASYFVSSRRQDNDFVSFFLRYYDNTVSGTPNFTDLQIEIRVYP